MQQKIEQNNLSQTTLLACHENEKNEKQHKQFTIIAE